MQPHDSTPARPNVLSDFAELSGKVLAVSYPVLALSTGVRAIFQLFFKEGITDNLPPLLSALAATCYLLATIGFVVRQRWAWQLSVGVLAFETLMTLVVGTLSITHPALIGRTVWRWYGADYAFFPLFQPLLGLAWLFRGDTLRAYGVRR